MQNITVLQAEGIPVRGLGVLLERLHLAQINLCYGASVLLLPRSWIFLSELEGKGQIQTNT